MSRSRGLSATVPAHILGLRSAGLRLQSVRQPLSHRTGSPLAARRPSATVPTMAQVAVHRSCFVDRLAATLAADLRQNPPLDPHQAVTVVIGSRGMARWLRLQLAQQLGICAGIRFVFPGQFVGDVLQVLGHPAPEPDPYAPAVLAHQLLPLLPELPILARYLQTELGKPLDLVDSRAWGLARELADLFDRYQWSRPDWLLAWQQHRSIGGDQLTDEAWQAPLWRQLQEKVARTYAQALPLPSRVMAACATLQHLQTDALARAEALPNLAQAGYGSVYVFGVSSLPVLHLELLASLGKVIQVHAYLFAPSQHFLGELTTRRELKRQSRNASPEQALEIAQQWRSIHPLLHSLGRVSRDMQMLLLARDLDPSETTADSLWDAPTLQELSENPQSTLLEHLQASLRDMQGPPEPTERPRLSQRDDSVQVHACPGLTRQVEVLRDELLQLFEKHPHLHPRDVVVMTPDVEAAAPLVRALFGEGQRQRGAQGAWEQSGFPRIPVEISDLSVRAINPLAQALLRTVALALARVTASSVADWLSLPVVAARFSLAEAELTQIRGWLGQSGIRWAWDASDRKRHGQPEDVQNTLWFGLERLAWGVVAAQDAPALWPLGDRFVAPWPDIEAGSAQTVGRFALALKTLRQQVEVLRKPRTLVAWRQVLVTALDSLTVATAPQQTLRAEVVKTLESMAEMAGETAHVFTVDALQVLLSAQLDSAQGGDRPVSGAVTLCALQPQRSVPFAVVCLLGLDDSAFPRSQQALGFDMTARQPRLGDRDTRDDDRHILLESLLAAGEHLLLFYDGRDPCSGVTRAPSVPVAELLETMDAYWLPVVGDRLSSQICQRHGVQPWSRQPSDQTGHMPTFDRRMAQLAMDVRSSRPLQPPLMPASLQLQPRPQEDWVFSDLLGALRAPVQALLQGRLGLRLSAAGTTLEDREPFALEGLGRYQVLRGALADARQALEPNGISRWRSEGLLPLGTPGRVAWQQLSGPIDVLRTLAGDDWHAPPQPALRVQLGPAQWLVGTSGLAYHGADLVDVDTTDPGSAARLLRAWLALLATAVAQPGPHQARLYGLVDGEGQRIVLQAPDNAEEVLSNLVAVADNALQGPLLLFAKASAAVAKSWAKPKRANEDPVAQALAAWGDPERPQPWDERLDPYIALAFGEENPWFDGHQPDPRWLELAKRVWLPLWQAVGDGDASAEAA